MFYGENSEACRRREVVRHLQAAYDVSERKACGIAGFGRASHRYVSRGDPEVALRLRMTELAEVRVRYSYRRLHMLLQREGWQVNHKKIDRCTPSARVGQNRVIEEERVSGSS